jgi:hypothetical protein
MTMFTFRKIINTISIKNHNADKRMPVWKMIVIDLFLTAVSLGIFSYYQLVMPRTFSDEKEIIVATAQDIAEQTFALPESEDVKSSEGKQSSTLPGTENTPEATATEPSTTGASTKEANTIESSSTANNTKETNAEKASNIGSDNNRNKDKNNKVVPTNGKKINYGNTNTMDIASDAANSKISYMEEVVTEVNNYQGDNIEFTTSKVELGSGSDKITYYRSDIYVTNVKYIKTAFASGEYGKNLRASTADMAEDNDALLAISGDFYGNGETGIVIRNGILYRSTGNDADTCVLFTDGSMKTYSPEEFDADEVLAQGAWQAWTFGPELLDGKGNMLASFNTTTYLNSMNPRCAIGYVEPGHYVFVVVDGREEGYSMGVTLSELAQIMVKAGCQTAYNLDGGKSAAMVYDGSYVNRPAQGGRTISDIVYIGE